MRALPLVGSAALGVLMSLQEAGAQSLAAVPHPDVSAADRNVDYRAGYALPDDGRTARFGQRLHFQQALNDRWRLRLLVQQGERADGVVVTQFVSPQAQYQLAKSEKTGGWDSAVRVDGFIPVDGRPGRARIGIFNAFALGAGAEARSSVFLAREIGARAQGGVQIEAREELSFIAAPKTRVGVQLFHGLNSTARIGGFDDQRHQLGVFARSKVARRIGVEAGWLFGLSDAAPDADLRVIFTYSL